MKTIQEVKAQFKKEGLYLNNSQFKLTNEIKEVLKGAAEFYRYIIHIDNDVIYEVSIDDDDFTKTFKGTEGLIKSLENWYSTMEDNYKELTEEAEPDTSTISLANSYQRDMGIILGFIETLK